MVRHDLLPGAISPAPRGVPEAAAPTALIAARGLPPSHPPGVKAAVSGAVDLAPVATTANQDLLAAQGAQKEAAAAAVVEIATAPEATFPWTRSASGAIMPLQSCSGTVWGAAPRSLPSSVGAAPVPTIDRDCSVSGAALSPLERRLKTLRQAPDRVRRSGRRHRVLDPVPAPQPGCHQPRRRLPTARETPRRPRRRGARRTGQRPMRRLAHVGPQGPPARAPPPLLKALRSARVPPVDYVDKPSRRRARSSSSPRKGSSSGCRLIPAASPRTDRAVLRARAPYGLSGQSAPLSPKCSRPRISADPDRRRQINTGRIKFGP